MGSPPNNKNADAVIPSELATRMRVDWDERIRHDYRYWMSDGVESDARMWETGKRDLALLLGDAREQFCDKTALEIGCGVGRLLNSAADIFSRVIGIDVSTVAVEKARAFLKERNNISVLLGNGINFDCIQSSSVDLVYTFAALSSMPVRVIAAYLAETSRVLKIGGEIRLQVYLGSEQPTIEEDSIAIRSFARESFIAALTRLGFSEIADHELVLPFEVSDPANGLVAVVVRARKVSEMATTADAVYSLLVPQGEARADHAWSGSKVEYWMALNRARTAMDSGDLVEAKRALEFAVAHYKNPEPDVLQLLEELRRDIESGERAESVTLEDRSVSVKHSITDSRLSLELWHNNVAILKARFPQIAANLPPLEQLSEYTSQLSEERVPVLMRADFAYDQLQKPMRAAELWAERAIQNPRAQAAAHAVVAGFGSGYHIEALLNLSTRTQLHVFEPDLRTLSAAMALRNLSPILRQISSLLTEPSMLSGKMLEDGAEDVFLHIHPQTQAIMRHAVDELKSVLAQRQGLSSLSPSIAVVGPLYGGSLPIAKYTATALEKLGQRVFYYDLSRFYGSYKGVEEMIRGRDKVNTLQSYYVEMVSQLVLEGVTERPVDILICLAQAPLSARVLTEMRKRGIITVMWFVEDCRRFLTWRQISPFYDYMFLIQKGEYLKQVEGAGAGKAVYLPVGCDPDFHAPCELSDEERARWGSQLSFLGAGFNNRVQMFAGLARRDFKIWGTEWPTMPPFDRLVQEGGRRIDPSEYVKIFNSSAINLNLHSSMERDVVEPNGDFVNPRTFELAACGAFQLTDRRTLLPEMFEYDSEIATFSTPKEMEDGIDYYLANPQKRLAMAERARARALRDHTYTKRLEAMLGVIYADRYSELKARADAGPWPKTLSRAKNNQELYERYRKVYARGMEPKLEELVADIQTGKGKLTKAEHHLLFLHHVKGQINYVQKLRAGE